MWCGTLSRARPVIVILLLVLFTATAPLVTGDGGDPDPDDPGQATVLGRVFSDSFEPIEGATLYLMLGNGTVVYSTTTNETGSYRFDEVDPDTYRLVATAAGFESHAVKLQVEPEAVHEVHFMLVEIPQPWVDGPNDWDGFIGCWISIATCDGVDPNHSTTHSTQTEPESETATLALEWQPNNFLGAEELRLVVEDQEGSLIADETGPSPLELRIDDGLQDVEGLTFRVQPETTSLVYQQTFTLWWALHYVDPAPDGYSPLSEGQ